MHIQRTTSQSVKEEITVVSVLKLKLRFFTPLQSKGIVFPSVSHVSSNRRHSPPKRTQWGLHQEYSPTNRVWTVCWRIGTCLRRWNDTQTIVYQDNPSLNYMISSVYTMPKTGWEERIPMYMCERAQKVMEKLHSPLVDVLTELTLSKMSTLWWSFMGSWGQSATVKSASILVRDLMEYSLRERDAVSLFYILFVVFVNMDEFRQQYLYYGRNRVSE